MGEPLRTLYRPRHSLTLYCDLDGVLTDFQAGVAAIDPFLAEMLAVDPPAFWKLIAERGSSFWDELAWQRGGRTLWRFLRPLGPIILTGVPRACPACTAGKRSWIERELGRKFAATAIIGPSRNKRDYARPGAVLIDDQPLLVDDFRQAGGMAILHVSAASTIRAVRALLAAFPA